MGAFLFCYSRKEDSVEQKLRQNEEHFTDLQLWLNSDTNIWDLADALEQNTTVQQVCLLIHESFGGSDDTDDTVIVDGHPAQQQHAHQHDHDENSTVTTVTDHTEQTNQSLVVEEHHHHSNASSANYDVLALFRALGGLPQLTRLFVNTYRFPFVAKLPILAVASLFDRRPIQHASLSQQPQLPLSNNLVEFKLWRTDLTVSQPDHAEQHLLEWAQAMVRHCHNLREFRLIKCRLILQNNNSNNNDNTNATATAQDQRQEASPNRQPRQAPVQRHEASSTASTTATTAPVTSSLDPLMQGLSKLPFLQDVELTATELSDLGFLSPWALSRLLKDAPNLQSFSLSNFDLSEDAVLAIAHGLVVEKQHQDHPPTKEPSTKKAIQLPSIHNEIAPETKSSTTNNTRCKVSHVRHVKLSKVGITASMFRKPLRESFHTVLESNYHLESLFLFDERNLQEEIAFYTKLNRLGRLKLLQQNDNAYNAPLFDSTTTINNQEWIDLLLQVQHDLPVLYYFVRVNPLILCAGTHQSASAAQCPPQTDRPKHHEQTYRNMKK